MRLPLFEFEDQPWFPSVLRDYQTGFIGFTAEFSRLYESVPGMLEKAGAQRVVDLASGAGQPAIESTEQLRSRGGSLLLTDKYPNQSAADFVDKHLGITYLKDSVDLTQPFLPEGDTYTLFNAFHHFDEDIRLDIVKRVHEKGGSLLIFEPLRRNIFTFLQVAAATLIGPLLFTPFIRPFTWSRIFFTYLLPIGILVTFWDGAVSVLRALSEKDCERLRIRAEQSGIAVEYGTLRSRTGRITYLRSL